MLLAHHCIFSMYGFWLPNDPRGSGSDYVAKYELFRYGKATLTHSPVSVAAKPHDRTWKPDAARTLRYPPVEITGQQAVAVAAGFRLACQEGNYKAFACAILPNHVHLVIGAHHRNVRTLVGHLRSRATRELKAQNLWHSDARPVWGAHGWNVRLESEQAVLRAIRYVEQNPLKEGKRRQTWSFVAPFELEAALRLARDVQTAPRLKRKIGGAALRSHAERLQREAGAEATRRERRG